MNNNKILLMIKRDFLSLFKATEKKLPIQASADLSEVAAGSDESAFTSEILDP